MSQGTPQKQPLFHGYSVLSTFFAFTVKVEPQSLQLRCQNDKRRPLAQFWPTTPHCLSPQTTPEVLYTDCSSTTSWANSQKPRNIAVHALKARRLLFSTDFGSHQTIIRARVDGNEGVELEGVTALALDQQSEEVIDINGKNKKTIASMHIPQVNNIAT
ncbi:uncharacterized protein LOC108157562 isoform X2 [Drosophila miranda]|uniref:uncharacterized protein LOC108157562 isoform X2 n=1 Tax=Drosophila miranda TaxID=7229 RepID=UPI0007E77FA1|nr:uncharacterized protein LOC108157562 isoform X2 [Drosophila miranda]